MSEGNKHNQVSIFDCVAIKIICRWWLKKIQDCQTYADKKLLLCPSGFIYKCDQHIHLNRKRIVCIKFKRNTIPRNVFDSLETIVFIIVQDV